MRFLGPCLLAATALFAAPASALIVVDGKIVAEWPDQPRRAARATAAQGVGGIGFYPNPQEVWTFVTQF